MQLDGRRVARHPVGEEDRSGDGCVIALALGGAVGRPVTHAHLAVAAAGPDNRQKSGRPGLGGGE